MAFIILPLGGFDFDSAIYEGATSVMKPNTVWIY
jgi:hypothetical protein